MIRTQAHLRCEQNFFLGGGLLVAGAPVADWGGVSTWGQEGLSCHPPPVRQPDLELGDVHHLHVGVLAYLHLQFQDLSFEDAKTLKKLTR